MAYQDYLDTNGGEHGGCVRDISEYYDDNWGPEDDDERYESIRITKLLEHRQTVNRKLSQMYLRVVHHACPVYFAWA